MSWQQVKAKTKVKHAKNDQVTVLSEARVKQFLSSFKTTACSDDSDHDARSCRFYHKKETDRRRDPYKTMYSPEECSNTTEKVYHPTVFRTAICSHAQHGCPFGALCSRAHDQAELRDRNKAETIYYSSVQSLQLPPKLQLLTFLPDTKPDAKRDYTSECHSLWVEHCLQSTSIFVALGSLEWFLTTSSNELFAMMQESAFENGLGIVEKIDRGEKHRGLRIRGIHVDVIHAQIKSMLQPPSDHFSIKESEYGSRIVDSLRKMLGKPETRRSVTLSGLVHIQIIDETRVRISAVHSGRGRADTIIGTVLDKIEFWIRQEGYDKFVECGCCFERRNADEGVSCANGHFYCSVSQCFETMVTAQILQIRNREDALVCPECKHAYSTQKIASHLPSEVWEQVHKAIIDKNVEKEAEVLQRNFDERLQEKVNELMSKYGDADEVLRAYAKREAKTIRDTIMNLSCPHCGIVYSEFTGCMALKCGVCDGNFCGYCHHKTTTGQGAHEHVRQCLMNETSNSSYYATPEQIEKAQRRYRTRELKKTLRSFKKDLQNAIVIELAQDLHDVKIQPEALFEFGNLQGDLF